MLQKFAMKPCILHFKKGKTVQISASKRFDPFRIKLSIGVPQGAAGYQQGQKNFQLID
jgi:hypothetical protein